MGRAPPAKLGEGRKVILPYPSLAGGGEKGLASYGIITFGICAYVRDFYEFRDCYVRDRYVRDDYVVPKFNQLNHRYHLTQHIERLGKVKYQHGFTRFP